MKTRIFSWALAVLKELLILVLVASLLAPIPINAAESDETGETMEVTLSDDPGTWEAINEGLANTYVNALVTNPLTPGTIYAGTDGGVFKSANGGGSWSVTGLTTAVKILAISPTNPSILYASENSDYPRVFRTTDGGVLWTDITLSPGPPGSFVRYTLVVDPSDPGTFYVSNNHEPAVFQLTGGGTNRTTFGEFGFVYSLAIDPTNSSTIYAGTEDNGVYKYTKDTDWSPMSSGLTNLRVYALAIDPKNTSIIYAGTNGGISKSTNGGKSWSASGLVNTRINLLAIDPLDPNGIYAGTNGGVFESTDGGASWNAINNGLTNNYVTSLAIDPLNPDIIIYAGTDGGGVFKYSAAGGPPSLHVTKSGTGSGTVTSTPVGIDCGATCRASFTEGTSLTLTASADAGSTFTGWSGGGCSGTDPCTIILNSNTTIEASFALSGDCAYTISPTNKTLKANGGNISVSVSGTGQETCPVPPVVEEMEWISVSGAPTWKANKGTVKLVVTKNLLSQSRTGVVSIGGEDLTIGQDGAICQLTTLKPSSGKYPNTGDSGSFDVTVSPQDCGWNVATTFDWIHLDTTTGTGNGTVAFHLDANGTGKNRTGKIYVSLIQNATKKKTFTVNESK